MNPIYSISLNKISLINSWKNCVVFLILLFCISYNTEAQSFHMVGKVTGILTLNPSGLTLENKAISIGKDAHKETSYKIVAAPSKVEDCPNKEKLIGLCSSI